MKTREQVIEKLKGQIALDPEGSKVPRYTSRHRSRSSIDILSEIEGDTPEGREYLENCQELDVLATARKSK